MDIFYVLLLLLFFAASLGLIKLCEKASADFRVRGAYADPKGHTPPGKQKGLT